ncbi:ABC-type spermidine/putrescine transport system,ATPase component [Halapricum desulfuricans]|uniref:ABC-type D-xylose/L-arabinose transporter n=1 Tax=Halapricum desulfuricans TaxID=2841257 RepID=A0A897NEL3_9EURY|nr:ABC transporter ATP-binding protein [Halapricum desulfuricans]QSG10978.1 ABC-type spermidine/putrescine transport system,ATPase component [Halapricum desulfuricans]
MASVTLDGVTKVFQDESGDIVAVDDLNLEIRDGEFLVLVGPSGCGKSTTLRMVAGLETPTEGTIHLGNRPITNRTPQERDIAMVFQSYALYPHMTVRGNMSFGLEESTDLSDAEIREQVEDAAELLDIDNLLDRQPDELSGGQQQRVALGRAIVREPEAFLLDEPLANLDAKLRAEMRTELQQLQENLGTTTIYVTHDQTEAMTMSDRIAVLNDGELQQVGTPLECYHRPNNQFVAGFIGEPSMNFLPVTLEDGTLVGEHFEYSLSEDVRADLEGHTELVFGIRPEDIDIVDSPTGAHEFLATVGVVEPQGDENTVHLAFEGQERTESELTATIGGMRSAEEGASVGIELPENAIHVFDAETGNALHNRSLQDVETDQPLRGAEPA